MANNNKYIHYGFGEDYLPKWGLNQALREIYQNFLDYGDYKEEITDHNNKEVTVTLSNNYSPDNLEFLRIGNSNKNGNKESIGKHGEGLKMAFLIFLREENYIKITTSKHIISPYFYNVSSIGKCFGIKYKENKAKTTKFTLQFQCNKEDFMEFHKGILGKEDFVFKLNGHGSIVEKKEGNIYSGGLFVCNLKNFSKAYDILPSNMPLDRDREVPRSFDVSYHSSKIKEAHGKWDVKDLESNDTTYIDSIPQDIKEQVEPVLVGNSVEFVVKGKEKVITNQSAKDVLRKDTFFQKAIKNLKLSIMKHLGLYDLLIEFKKKHVSGIEAEEDFDYILQQVKK